METTRRSMAGRLIAAMAAGAAAFRAGSIPAEAAAATGVPKVVYHLSDPQKVNFVIGNMQNHIRGMGGPDKVSLTLVVHGPALEQFRVEQATANLEAGLQVLATAGSTLVACGNTLKGGNMTLADIVPGFVVAEEGGVVRLAQLQAQGYAYLRP
jgi:uncharacterized protein